jgi:aminocarboxymuconate-semialdehyde decarboxylase
VHDDRSLQLLVDHAGPDRLVYGTNFAGWDSGGDHGPGPLVDTLTANAERLLRI